MRNNLIGCCFLVLFLWSCVGETEVDSIDKSDNEIVELLGDLYISEIAINKHKNKEKDSMRLYFRNRVAKTHGLREGEMDTLVKTIQKDLQNYVRLSKMASDTLNARHKLLIDDKD